MIGRGLWILVTIGAVAAALAGRDLWDRALWMPLIAVTMTMLTTLALLSPRARMRLGGVLAGLRRRPILYWGLILFLICAALTAWVLRYQPSRGRWLEAPEVTLMLFALWLILFLIGYNLDEAALREMGGRIAQSPLSGVMVLLTTTAVLFWGAEGYLRLFYITTDGYALTAMSYLWHFNYMYGRENSLGYRDAEPLPDSPDRIRIAVIGDSFAIGHGIDDAGDMFAQRLQQQLDERYDVNLIAQQGWSLPEYTANLRDFPFQPDIVILSYYLNEIEPLAAAFGRIPYDNFTVPQDPLAHVLLRNFCAISAVYYLGFQFFNDSRTQNYATDLLDIFEDDAIWSQHADQINSFIAEVEARQARLIVLVWPSLVAVERSVPAVQKVSGYFAARGAQIVDFSTLVDGRESLDWVVNRFDFHPSIEANRIAGDGLYRSVMALDPAG
jgi:hypothetical protein